MGDFRRVRSVYFQPWQYAAVNVRTPDPYKWTSCHECYTLQAKINQFTAQSAPTMVNGHTNSPKFNGISIQVPAFLEQCDLFIQSSTRHGIYGWLDDRFSHRIVTLYLLEQIPLLVNFPGFMREMWLVFEDLKKWRHKQIWTLKQNQFVMACVHEFSLPVQYLIWNKMAFVN